VVNPLQLCSAVDQRVFAIRTSNRTEAEKVSAYSCLFGEIEVAITSAFASGNENAALAYRAALDHLKSQVGESR